MFRKVLFLFTSISGVDVDALLKVNIEKLFWRENSTESQARKLFSYLIASFTRNSLEEVSRICNNKSAETTALNQENEEITEHDENEWRQEERRDDNRRMWKRFQPQNDYNQLPQWEKEW